jgi:hypothetical protein
VARGGPIASEVAVSTELEDVLSRYTQHITPTGRANYLYYDRPGLGIDPHVDNEEFSLNVVMMLEHVHRENPSALVLYPGDAPMQRIFLSPGEIIALYADSVTHARERMATDERVSIVAFGFQPILGANMQGQLLDKLRQFNGRLTEAEQANFKLLLGLAAGGLTPDLHRPSDIAAATAFDTVSDTLATLQPYSKRISYNGLAYRGRPDFMTDPRLLALQEEARTLRASARRFDEHFLGCGAPIANQLALSETLSSFVRTHAGDVKPTGIASFLYYDEVGQGIDAHIDTDIFSLNVLLMLSHRYKHTPRSALVLLPPRHPAERIELEPGEIVIMFAGSIAHGRERMKPDEAVSILTFGFHPLGI